MNSKKMYSTYINKYLLDNNSMTVIKYPKQQQFRGVPKLYFLKLI